MAIKQLHGTALAVSFALSASVQSAMGSTPHPVLRAASAEPATVFVSGNTLRYVGKFSAASTQAFKAATSSIERGRLKRIVISSAGGVTTDAREVATWVHDMGLVVEVDTVCFSSCANYVFPAGKARIIRKNAFVGWHGNERGMAIEALRKGGTLKEEFRNTLPPDILEKPPEVLAAYVDQLVESATASHRDEAAFYAKLGLNDAFSVCAVGSVAFAKYPGLETKRGWGFSIKDMNRLGLTNISYLGKGRYEQDSKYFKKYLELLGAHDCWSWLK